MRIGLLAFCIIFLSGFSFTFQPLGSGIYNAPSWSPDGKFLAFTFSAFGMDYDALWLFEAQTGRYRKLYEGQDVWGYSGLVWQNNDTLWFITREDRMKLHSVEIATGQIQNVMDAGTGSVLGMLPPSWASFTFYPDEEHIVFVLDIPMFQKSESDLYSIDLDTLTTTRLTETPEIYERGVTTSPDKQFLAYGGDRNGLEIRDQNGNRGFVASVSTPMNQYSWSADGKWLLYTDSGLYLTSSDGKGFPQQVSDDEGANTVSWSPEWVAYTTVGVPGSNDLWIVSAESLGLPAT